MKYFSLVRHLCKRLVNLQGLCVLAVTVFFCLELLGMINLAGIHRRLFGLEIPRSNCPRHPKYNLTIMTIFKNTSPYLEEWLEFHFMVGVERVYMYDNNSTDGALHILKPYIESGMVVYKFWPNKFHVDFDGYRENYSQKSAVEHALLSFRCDSKWMALIDTDEFLMPGQRFQNHSLQSLLTHYQDFGGVALAWLRFGTSSHIRPPALPVIEAYTKRRSVADPNYKHIIQPRRLRGFMNIHEMFYYDGYYPVDEKRRPVVPSSNKNILKSYDVFRLHHFFTRSCLDWWIRIFQRGAVSGGLSKYKFGDLERLDSNEFDDRSALNFVARLKKQLKWDGKKWQERYFPLSKPLPAMCA